MGNSSEKVNLIGRLSAAITIRRYSRHLVWRNDNRLINLSIVSFWHVDNMLSSYIIQRLNKSNLSLYNGVYKTA